MGRGDKNTWEVKKLHEQLRRAGYQLDTVRRKGKRDDDDYDDYDDDYETDVGIKGKKSKGHKGVKGKKTKGQSVQTTGKMGKNKGGKWRSNQRGKESKGFMSNWFG
jgi:hypothetical protein